MSIINEEAFAVSLVSIFLYLSLFATCVYYASRFWEVVKGRVEGGLYGTPKFIFFIVLGASALLDMPTFIVCASKGGPHECIWDHSSYAFVWSCHLIATCGYMYAVITPSILWSDIIRQKDGNFWNSASPLDGTKIFFRITFVIYCCVIFTNVLGVIIFSKSTDEAAYSNSNALGALNNCLMPILLVVVTFGCFYSGLRLRHYVMNVKLGGAVQLRILLKLNFTMFMICASYTMRAILVMSLYEDVPHAYRSAMHGAWPYAIWMPLTQWVPFLLCSFCLVNEMKFHNAGGKRQTSSSSSVGAPSREASLAAASRGAALPSVDVTDPAYEARSKNYSVDSMFSDIARSEATGRSSRSRSRHTSRPGTEPDTDDILMSTLAQAQAGPHKQRAVSADNYFDAQHGDVDLAVSDSGVGSDHFFTTSAMHLRSSHDTYAP
jgi:hypothetical protein